MRGNDAACEARKKLCPLPVIGPVITAPGTPLGPGGVLGPGGPGIGHISGEDLKACLQNPNTCPKRVLNSAFYNQLAFVVNQYLSFLWNQGKDRFQHIPQEIISGVQRHYPQVNLNTVRFATNINTLHGQNITIGTEIYLVRDVNFRSKQDLELLFHELEHVVQYQLRGGVQPFLNEYIAKSAGSVIQNQSINIHDRIDIERAAISKASQVVQAYWGRDMFVQNNCIDPVQMAFSYLRTSGKWKTTGYWRFDPNQGFVPFDEDGPVHSRNRRFFFYGEGLGQTKRIWAGNHSLTVELDNRRLGFRQFDADLNSLNNFQLTLICLN